MFAIIIELLAGLWAFLILIGVGFSLYDMWSDSVSLREDDEIPDHWRDDLGSTTVVPVLPMERAALRLVANEMGTVE